MKASLVIDCSITMAWLFADERTEATAKVQERLISEAAVVPTLWYLEVTNVLAMAEKRQRLTAADAAQFVQLLGTLDIEGDAGPETNVVDALLPLYRRHNLTSYDATYLELAIRRQLPIATLDEELRAAAMSVGIEVLGK